MEKELATTSLELNFEFHFQFPCSSTLTELSNFRQPARGGNKRECSKGNDVITNVTSANQHFASMFWMEIFKFQRRSCKLSSFCQSAPESLLAGYFLRTPSAPITNRIVSVTVPIFHILVLSVHIIRPPSLFLGRTDHDRWELQCWIPSSVDVNTLFFQLPQKLNIYFLFSP